MFNIFKKKQKTTYEGLIIKAIVYGSNLEYVKALREQLEEGIIEGSRLRPTDIPNYFGLVLNESLREKYYNKSGRNYSIGEVEIRDKESGKMIKFTLYVSYGLLIGYSIFPFKNIQPDINSINLERCKITFLDELDYNKIEFLLSTQEKANISKAEIYEVQVEEKTYFHIKDLEDGDFIAIDLKKNVFMITHDPLKATKIITSLNEILQ
ncbi:MAG TPA: hypothetical protein PKN75_12735 [Bacteroidia bacterium]|nr:hypothetical protein [Bacteroidia bacterium]